MIWLRKGRQVASPKGLGFASITAVYLALVLQTWDPDWLAHSGYPGSWGTRSLSKIVRLLNCTRWPLVNGYVPGPQHPVSWGSGQALGRSRDQSEPSEESVTVVASQGSLSFPGGDPAMGHACLKPIG